MRCKRSPFGLPVYHPFNLPPLSDVSPAGERPAWGLSPATMANDGMSVSDADTLTSRSNGETSNKKETYMQLHEVEALVGRRGSATFDSTYRSAVRQWMKSQGCKPALVDTMTIAELNAAFNDTSDTTLNALKKPLVSGTTAPAPAPAVPVSALGAFEAPVRAAIDEALSGFTGTAGVDVDQVKNLVDDIVAPLKPIIEAFDRDTKVSARAPIYAASASGCTITDKVAPYYKPGTDCGTNVLVLSPPSFGKSHVVREIGKSYDLFLEHGCSEDVDEWPTALGGVVPDGAGGFIVSDGVLTQAVRAAKNGKTVLLFLDELLRLSPLVENALLSFLTGVKTDAGRIYRLRTRHVKDGVIETIDCPAKNLHIVGAGNLGMKLPQEAFWSRWEPVRVEWTQDTAVKVANNILRKYGVEAPRLAESFARAMGESRILTASGELAYPIHFRILERAAATRPDGGDAEAAIKARLRERIPDNTARWDADLGSVVEESFQAATRLVAKYF